MSDDAGFTAQQVDHAVNTAAAAYGARVMKNVLLEVNGRASRYDYILLDRFGLLVLGVEFWPGRAIRGGSSSAEWQARSDGKKPERFSNPFKANARRLDDLQEAMLVCGRRLAPEYFGDLVVFVAADTSGVKIDDMERMKLVAARELAAALQARHDFAPNPGLLERGEIDDLISLLATIDRTDSRGASVAEQTGAKKRFSIPLLRRETTSQVAVADGAVGLAPSAPRLSADRYPGASQDKPKRSIGAPALLLAAVAGLGVWLFLYGGYPVVIERAIALTQTMQPSAEQGVVPATVSAPAAVSVESAKSIYREAAPEQYAATLNVDRPRVEQYDGLTIFTWDYTLTEGPSAGQERWIALTFDAAGQLRGVTGP